jgi:hypothetical protein
MRDLNDLAQQGQPDPELDYEEVTAPESIDDVPIEAYDEMPDGRAKVRLVTRADEVVTATLRALSKHEDVFVRERGLVRVVVDDKSRALHRLNADALIPVLSCVADFVRLKFSDGEEAPKELPSAPPLGLARQLVHLGEYPGLRVIDGIAAQPILHPTGHLFTTPGYDPTSRLWYAPIGRPPAVREHPTQEHAREGVAKLLQVVRQFPFVGDADRSAFLAAVLSPIARSAWVGPCPGFVFGANQAGSGKSKLAEIACIIGTGATVDATPYPDDEAEQEKTMRALAFGGRPIALFDNIAGSIGGAALDVYLTATRYSARVFGTSEERSVIAHTVLFFTANATTYRADTTRRVLPIRLQSETANPEGRTFDQADIVGHVLARREELYGAALDILRAYMLAGRPACSMASFGSYENWSSLIRGALWYAGQPDPIATRAGIEATNTETGEHGRLVAFLADRFRSSSFTSGEVADLVDVPMSRWPPPSASESVSPNWTLQDTITMLEELNAWDRSAKRVNRKSLGWRLLKYVERPTRTSPPQRIVRLPEPHPRTKVPQWRIE